jgi:hypothetical protein
MQNRRFIFGLVLGISFVLVFLAPGGFVRAQSGGPNDDGDLEIRPDTFAALADDVVQIQGRLTNASGIPINGNVSVTASIYNVSSGGAALCSDTDIVSVANGLFTMAMDYCTASVFNGDQLWLGLTVGSDAEMTPRQPIYAVPYAWALRPGAIVKGADSYIFVPGNALIKNLNTDTTRWDIQANGAARIWRGATAGTKVIYLPVTLPGVLYGQNVTLKQMTVYYRSQNGTNSYIDETDLYVQSDADSWLQVVTDTNNHTSNTATSYTLALTTNNVLTPTQGILGLFFYISFANDTDYLQIGGVRLLVGHQ